jgi:sulfatase maturation enzyme AslB (radical SAM superfamily)
MIIKPLCYAPFKNVRMKATSDHSATFRPCCHYEGFSSDATVTDYLDSTWLANVREQMYQRELPASCNQCVSQEKIGLPSLRQQLELKHFSLDSKVVQLEAFPSNICNLRCFMCNQEQSISLASERKQLGWINDFETIDNADHTIETIKNLPDLKTVSFISGEFFLTKRANEILQLIAEKELAVRIITNGTVLDAKHVASLQCIAQVEIQISIDGIETAYEFMRYPARWATVDRNIQTFKKQLPHAELNFQYVVQCLNIHQLIPAMDYANNLLIHLRPVNLTEPNWLTWNVLTLDEAKIIADVLDQQMQQTALTKAQQALIVQYQGLLNSTTHDADNRQEFVDRMSQLLRYRGIDHLTIRQQLAPLPDLAEAIIKQYA